MGSLLSYSILSGVYLLLLFLAYRIFMARENQHSYNRAILLAIYAVAFSAVPLSSLLHGLSSPAAHPSISTIEGETIVDIGATEISGSRWATALIWAYIAGMVVVAFRTVMTWIALVRVVRAGQKIVAGGYTVILTDDERFAPFSWVNIIVVNRADFDGENSVIATHEKAHIAAHHWVDLFIAQIVCIINWFNPAAWLMREELMLVHEYQADMAVIDSGFNPRDYQMLLIKKAVGARFPSLANSLNHSKLKKRITMMYKAKSGVGSRLKALALVPALALALGVASVPALSAAVDSIGSSPVTLGKGSDNMSQDEIPAMNFKVKAIINKGIATTVVIEGTEPGNTLSTSDATLSNALVTYKAIAMQTDMTGGSATIKADFPVAGDEYDGTSVSVNVNGKTLTFPLDGITPEKDPAGYTKSPTPRERINTVASQSDYKIYIDGKEVDNSNIEKISSDNIESVVVVSPEKKILITLKK